ncbi:AraC family transcriptional regulator [Roseivirga sp. E12]|uniref:AraC family transcriptional regulator n=1 Tax=Roseivirga sp. E12 TaxID=2819237 RepID=UPI001ABC0E2D|nr:AraC family transcriptional regulator [Roseivirga sp. E12]MBO3698650.1 AraC family transcriptional regulator ligand-binding domain-containing protein [Roseivirga sp. E12]
MAFNGRFLLNIIHFASLHGADIKSLISHTKLNVDTLNEEHCQLDSTVYNSVINECVSQTGDDHFGLHLGESLNLSAAGLVAQITQTSETIKQALQYACDFAQLACSSLPMALTEENEYYKLTLTPEPTWHSQSKLAVKHTIDGTLVFTIREYHELTRKKHFPLRIHLPFAKPHSTLEYERLFQCPVHFNKAEIAVFFDKRHMEESIVTSDYQLLKILVAHAEERIREISSNAGFFEQVKASVASLIKPEFPSLDQVASHFNMSSRTFQRKLSSEGHSFKEIIESLREEFAFSYLKRPELSISQIAYLLNYNDASSFIRSFKRWTGYTPKKWRSQNSQA